MAHGLSYIAVCLTTGCSSQNVEKMIDLGFVSDCVVSCLIPKCLDCQNYQEVVALQFTSCRFGLLGKKSDGSEYQEEGTLYQGSWKLALLPGQWRHWCRSGDMVREPDAWHSLEVETLPLPFPLRKSRVPEK